MCVVGEVLGDKPGPHNRLACICLLPCEDERSVSQICCCRAELFAVPCRWQKLMGCGTRFGGCRASPRRGRHPGVAGGRARSAVQHIQAANHTRVFADISGGISWVSQNVIRIWEQINFLFGNRHIFPVEKSKLAWMKSFIILYRDLSVLCGGWG